MLKFLIAVDGSEHAKHAIEAVAKLARSSTQMEVRLLHVCSDPAFYGELTPTAFAQLDTAVHQQQASILNDAAMLARDLGLTVVATQGASGMVASEIVKAASAADVDQIVMGTRGMGAMGSMLLGSTAQRVVHMATMPVLLVK